MTRRDSLLALVVITIWGSNFLAIHVGLAELPPFALLTLRFVMVVVPAIFFIKRPQIPWRYLAGIGLATSAGQFSFLYLALHMGMSVGLAPLLLQAQVFLSMAIARAYLHERPTRTQLLGALVGAGGLALVASARAGTTSWIPVALVFLAALSWATGNVISRAAALHCARQQQPAPSGLGIVVWSSLFVPLPVGLLAITLEGPQLAALSDAPFPWTAIAASAFTAIASTHIGYGLWNLLLARNSASAIAPYALGIPVVGMMAAFIGLGETFTTTEIVGGCVVLAGVAIASVVGKPSRVRLPAQPVTVPAEQGTSRA